MKKIVLVLISVILICSAFADRKAQTDFRDSYTGQYSCLKSTVSRNFNGQRSVSSNTVTITFVKSPLDSALQVVLSGTTYILKVKNSIFLPVGPEHISGKFFNSDSVLLHLPLGRMATVTYKGKKEG